MTSRNAVTSRQTRETSVAVELSLDELRAPNVRTGLRFLDHMLEAFATHSAIGLTLSCEGDLDVDDHHTVEDCALTLGDAVNTALADRRGIRRFGFAYAPLDESLARVVIDLSGRPYCTVNLDLTRERIGDVASENLSHFFQSFASAARCALHVDVLRGVNDHHRAEAAFKALALAFRDAIAVDSGRADIPSTKGTLQ